MIEIKITVFNDNQDGTNVGLNINGTKAELAEIELKSLAPYLTPFALKIVLDYLDKANKGQAYQQMQHFDSNFLKQ